MHDVVIVGDGPAGLSAALILAKRKLDVVVYGLDETPMHMAMLYNYLGLPDMTGSAFQTIARAQVERWGARVYALEVTRVAHDPEQGFVVTTHDNQHTLCRYLIIATGTARRLAESLGVANIDGELQVDRDGRTHLPGLYVAGWVARRQKIQAIISAGDGAAAALDILSKEAGKDIHDFDLLPPHPDHP